MIASCCAGVTPESHRAALGTLACLLVFGPENGRFLIPALVILVEGLLLMRSRLEGGGAYSSSSSWGRRCRKICLPSGRQYSGS